ncbi:hypothetical protein VS_II0419 [Vibrio atlanticus]|uniref:Uncharacterized protein n=1 Tax=Vibrio atlanticus (strain LGP32) TaxID=575788 RepID=B7VR34_VIBA3|nr:hypothetical protein VS_II0419 [Vibrio atlanticus]
MLPTVELLGGVTGTGAVVLLGGATVLGDEAVLSPPPPPPQAERNTKPTPLKISLIVFINPPD